MAQSNLIAVVVAVAAFLSAAEASGVIGFDIHHRWSPTVRRWAEARGHSIGVQCPAHSSPEYYSELSRHDRALLSRRGLAGGDGLLAFAAGNATYQLSSLYSAIVSLGTPNATFLVALDTGSELFWVPCDCKQCAPMDNTTGLDLRPYSTRQSTTSKQVTCEHELCNQPNACVGGATNGSCPYTVRYVSPNTSTSGVLVEDVVYFAREGPDGAAGEALQAPVVFGCGQVQTGSLLEGDSPDGLLGLGMSKVSVPSVLASKGLIASDSFSMCFGDDGVGRINFGDTGSSRGQAETPFVFTRGLRPTYNVSFTSVNVGRRSAPVEFAAVMDSGTSFTYLNEPEYTAVATNFNSLVRERRANFSVSGGGSLPFEYCYELSSGQTDLRPPNVSLTTKGGAVFPVIWPLAVLTGRVNGELRPVGYCLAVIKSDFGINIVGQNFMTGLKVVFNRERSILGWQEFDCYKNARAADPAAPQPAPAPASLKPHENSDPNSRYPSAGAVPVVPQPTPSDHAASQQPSQLLLLPLLMVAAALV